VTKFAVYKLIRNCFGLLTAALIVMTGSVGTLLADEQEMRDGILGRIQMTQSYLDSKTATRITESGNDEARQLLDKARKLLKRGQQDLEQGNLESAKQQVNLSIQTFTAAGAANSNNTDSRQRMLGEVRSVRSEIDAYLGSFRTALAEKGPSMSGLLDQQYVSDLMSAAAQSQSTGDYRSARSNLTQAKQLIVDALIKIRNNETVIYTVEFQTPADEFRYERERYLEYVSLGQTVVENGEVAQSRITLFELQKKNGDLISQEAQTLADKGDYDDAIKRMEDAVKKMVQGLRMLGIQLSM
jgi:tetratricopeptide (TPR) repeat protein